MAALQTQTEWLLNATYTVDAREETPSQEVVPCVPQDDFAKSLTPEQRGELPPARKVVYNNALINRLAQAERVTARMTGQVFDEAPRQRGLIGNQGA